MNNYSKQREMILEEIKNTRIHPTAEQIYKLAIQKQPNISKSTVYRNINILVENQQIKKITMPTGPDRFDYLHKPHHHAICEMCGKIVDFTFAFPVQEIAIEVKQQTGFVTQVDCITIHGICETCKSKQ